MYYNPVEELLEKKKAVRYKEQMDKFNKTTIGKPAQWLIETAASIGLNFSDLSHEITNHFEKHSIKKHGNINSEKIRGQVAITHDDIKLLSDIVNNPDNAVISKTEKSEIFITYSKKYEDGTIIYYEEVLNSKKNKALRSKTMYKKSGSVSKDAFLKIVENNGHTEILSEKMVVGAGGNPGGEA
jgi:hypothetical protein